VRPTFQTAINSDGTVFSLSLRVLVRLRKQQMISGKVEALVKITAQQRSSR